MKIGLLGIGTVGSGVLEQLKGREDITIKKVLVRRERPDLAGLATFSFEEILNDPEIDTIVEVMGGLEPAYDYVLRALQAGKNVVTANKAMLCVRMTELMKAAAQSGAKLRIDASVGGGIPFLYNLMRSGRADEILAVSGIVNGTTNLILDTMQTEDVDFDAVLAQAQRAGYAEADPSADIDGLDARAKLCVASSIAFRSVVDPEDVALAGIRTITSADVQQFRRLGYVCRLLVNAEKSEDGSICAFVEPTLLKPSEPECSVRRNNNIAGMVGRHFGQQYFFGQGAGKDPTAFAVVNGLEDLNRNVPSLEDVSICGKAVVCNDTKAHRYYLRTTAPVALKAEMLDENIWLTDPISVHSMHALAAELRKADPKLFLAGIRE